MTKRPKRPRDPNELAKLIVDIATGNKTEILPEPRDAAAVSMGERGGKARASKLSAERRSEIAKKAAAGRWSKRT